MVLDTSAIIAILLNEPGCDRLVTAIENAEARRISAAAVVEAALVLMARYGDPGEAQLDRVLQGIGAEIVPFGGRQVTLARDAALRFGKGRHPAGLNFGDCFSYALAADLQEPLLFVGDDFSQTDVEVMPW